MKAIVKETAVAGATLKDVDMPTYGDSEVLIKVLATSICGTDYHIYSWDKWSQNRIKPPITMGHEFVGEVIKIGDKVTRVKVGDIVSAETHIVCNKCEQCRTGNAHICQNTEIIGVDRDGSFAEYLSLPEDNLIVNDKNVPLEILSVQEPFGNAVHTVLEGEIIGKNVAIVGCGPIGLMSIPLCKAVGAANIIAIDVNEYRNELSKELGATHVINPMKEDVVKRVREITGTGVDVVCEFSGNAMALKQAFKYVKLGGRISILGIPNEAVDIDIAELVFKGISVNGIVGRKMYKTWDQVNALLSAHRVDISKTITHKLKFDEYEKGMELMKSGNCGKIVLFL